MALLPILQQVEEGEDEHPDQVHEMPIETRHLDALGGRLAQTGADGGDGEDHQAGEDVGTVEAGEHKKNRRKLGWYPEMAELAAGQGAREAGAFADDVRPLVGLAAQEGGS